MKIFDKFDKLDNVTLNTGDQTEDVSFIPSTGFIGNMMELSRHKDYDNL